MVKFELLPLVGMESLWALNAFHKILMGVKQLPAYKTETYEDFFGRVEKLTLDEKEQIIREAIIFVDLMKDEIEALVRFASDVNGVPFTYTNTKRMNAADLFEIVVAVCVEISKIEIKFVTADEKKKSNHSQSTLGESLPANRRPHLSGRSTSLFTRLFRTLQFRGL